jgi:hypothetical protein
MGRVEGEGRELTRALSRGYGGKNPGAKRKRGKMK